MDDVNAAADLLKSARRIMVIGSSGAGKSTLSQKIAALRDLPYISMDRDFFWLPGWVKREKSEERRLIADAIVSDRWLLDGTGPSTFDLRLPRTELVVWLRLSRWTCLWGIFYRAVQQFGRTRPDMAPGCIERIPDAEFIRYVWTFEARTVPKILSALEKHGPQVPVLQVKSRREVHRLLDILAARN